MSQVGDAFSGGGSGVNDQTLSDASLGDQITGGDGSFGTGSANAFGAGSGPTEFSQFSDIANALNSGAPVGSSPTTAQSVSMTPPGTAAASGGDPAGAASGTQSNTTPGSTPTNQNQQQQSGGGQQTHDPDHAPPDAVAQLRTLLKGLSGKPTGPTGPVPTSGPAPFALPTLAAGQTGARSPQMPLPNVDPGETGEQSPGSFYGTPYQPIVQTASGASPAEAAIPPGAAQQRTSDADTPAARDINVHARKTMEQPGQPPQGMPAPQNEPGEVAPGGPALPTHKPTQPEAEQPEAAPAPQPSPAPSRLIQDIAGTSTGAPTQLADLAKIIVPLLPMLLGGLMGGGGRRGGHFHGGRFTHGVGRGGFNGFRGGMNAMRYHGGQHPAGRGAWPYHHPVHGWHMHGRPPGGGWLPLNPIDAQGLVGGGQGQGQGQGQQDPNAPDPNRPPKETGAEVGAPDAVGTSGAIPGVGAKEVDDYTRQAAMKYHIDPNVASKFLGTESSYGQAKKPGDNGTSFGPFQLHFAPDGKAMGDDFRRDTGKDPRDPKTWQAQIDYAMMRAARDGWSPGWTTTMNKLGMNQWSGIGGHMVAGQKPSNKEPSWAAAAPPPTLPVTSQPMVAGP